METSVQQRERDSSGVLIGTLLLMFAVIAWSAATQEPRWGNKPFWTGTEVVFGWSGLVILGVSLLQTRLFALRVLGVAALLAAIKPFAVTLFS